MVPISYLNPIAGTKLDQRAPLDPDEALTFLPELSIMAAGGKEMVPKERLGEIFAAGINAAMVGNN